MRDALMARLLSFTIRQRFLEKCNILFEDVYDKARNQELAHRSSEAFQDNHDCRAATGADEAKTKMFFVFQQQNQPETKKIVTFAADSDTFVSTIPQKIKHVISVEKLGIFKKYAESQ